jgi:hypothetical protein
MPAGTAPHKRAGSSRHSYIVSLHTSAGRRRHRMNRSEPVIAAVIVCARMEGTALIIRRPADLGAFQFVVLASLRAAQLVRGCTPRVAVGHKHTITAQLEVAAEMVRASPRIPHLPIE